jgi:predicted metal-binding protein
LIETDASKGVGIRAATGKKRPEDGPSGTRARAARPKTSRRKLSFSVQSDSVRGTVLPQRQSTVVRPVARAPVLVCKKCLARSDEGQQLKRSLKSELKRRSDELSRQRPRVVKASCFGICPKRAVVLASGATLQRGEYVLVREGDSLSEAVAILVPLGGETGLPEQD